MASPTGLGINIAHTGAEWSEPFLTQTLSTLKDLGISKVRVNLPIYLTENENPSFRNQLRLVCTTAKAMGFYVIWGYNAFPLNSGNRANFETQLRAGAVWAAANDIDEWQVGNEEDLNTGYSQADLRTALKEVAYAVKVTDGFPGVVSTAITTNVFAAWEADVDNWSSFMKLDLHIYGALGNAHFDNYAAAARATLGDNVYCGEWGVDSGRLAFSNDYDWVREMYRRMKLLENNNWSSYYYFAYAVSTGDEETRWSSYRESIGKHTTLLHTLANKRPIVVNVGTSIKDVEDTRPIVKDYVTCLNFSGDDGVITLGTTNPFTSSFYFSARIKWSGGNGGFQTIFAKRDSYAADGLMFSVALDDDAYTLAVDSVTSFVPFAYVFPVGSWIHMTWVHDVAGSAEKLYINGELYSTQGVATLGTKTDALISIGACQNPAVDNFNGRMEDVVIGTGVPTADEVYSLYVSGIQPGTVWRHLKLDEGSGTTATDSSANGVHGTISGATYVTDPVRAVRLAAGARTAVSRTSV